MKLKQNLKYFKYLCNKIHSKPWGIHLYMIFCLLNTRHDDKSAENQKGINAL